MTPTRPQLQARWRELLADLATATDPVETALLHDQLEAVEREAAALIAPPESALAGSSHPVAGSAKVKGSSAGFL